MALSLSAEQKSLLKIFKVEEQYIIPAYQRPYSWEFDQCFQLYTDLVGAFVDQQDYFVGNLVIARAENNRDTLEVIDGQQRLITLLLLIKILHLLLPTKKVLADLLEKEDWEGNVKIARIRSNVFETNDEDYFHEVLHFDFDRLQERYAAATDRSGNISDRLCRSKFEANALRFYHWLKFYDEQTNTDLDAFVAHLLKQVYLLPIELTGPTQEEANERALVIFETINNRGMNLQDADIFKARLYNKAKNVREEKVFIEQWTLFNLACENLHLEIDDIFRYYSHIVRGSEGITTGETNLRQFFNNEDFSPFELKKYKDILEDLFRIIEILEFIDQEKIKTTSLARWLQVIDAYTNQYPRYAVVNYLYVNKGILDAIGGDKGNYDDSAVTDFHEFLQRVIRYVYYQGSTSTVKFELYNIIKQVSSGTDVSSYRKPEIETGYFEHLGRLKKGFALLSYYLANPQALPSYTVDKILSYKDEPLLGPDWTNIDLDDIVDQLGNFLVLDIPARSLPLDKRLDYYRTSSINEVQQLFSHAFSAADFEARDKELKSRLVLFFK